MASLSKLVDADEDWLAEVLEYGLQAGKHNEFHEISNHLGLDEEHCLQAFTMNIQQNFSADFRSMEEAITKALENNK